LLLTRQKQIGESMGTIERDEFRSMLDSYEQCFLAMGILLKNHLPLPTLVLLYTVIDGLGWLAAPNPKPNDVRKRFCKWVDKWLLPDQVFECNAVDIYGARCAVLHTLTYESHLGKIGEARTIAYKFGGASETILRLAIEKAPEPRTVIVDLDKLIEATRASGARFLVYAADNPQMSKILFARAPSFFTHLDTSYRRFERSADDG